MQSKHDSNWKFWKLIKRAWRSGFSGMLVFTLTSLLLAPLHLLTSLVMFLLVLPIPMAKLNYCLLRHLLRHPLLLSAHWCEEEGNPVDLPATTNAPSSVSYFPSSSSSSSSSNLPSTAHPSMAPPPTPRPRPVNPNPGRPKSIFFWRSDSSLLASEIATNVPPIMTTPSLAPKREPSSYHLDAHKQYQIVLCTYRAMAWEYAKYTVGGINIIFINLLISILFTLSDFYLFQSCSKPVIFLGGIISTIPLSYFIGMAVSSITGLGFPIDSHHL